MRTRAPSEYCKYVMGLPPSEKAPLQHSSGPRPSGLEERRAQRNCRRLTGTTPGGECGLPLPSGLDK